MKYKWTENPPANVPGVSAAKCKIFPTPIRTTLKYAENHNPTIAIGQLRNDRWEVYILRSELKGKIPNVKLVEYWKAQSRINKLGYRPGYSNYQNAYRSISQHLKGLT